MIEGGEDECEHRAQGSDDLEEARGYVLCNELF